MLQRVGKMANPHEGTKKKKKKDLKLHVLLHTHLSQLGALSSQSIPALPHRSPTGHNTVPLCNQTRMHAANHANAAIAAL
jgi:hypothetical protein